MRKIREKVRQYTGMLAKQRAKKEGFKDLDSVIQLLEFEKTGFILVQVKVDENRGKWILLK